MNTNHWGAVSALIVGIGAIGTVAVPTASAASPDYRWIAAASSPSHEQLDWGYGPDQAAAESAALAQCAQLQRAGDCRLLASSPDCVAVAWDAAQPLNRAHGASGGGPQAVMQAAIRAAGQYANDPSVRCSWF